MMTGTLADTFMGEKCGVKTTMDKNAFEMFGWNEIVMLNAYLDEKRRNKRWFMRVVSMFISMVYFFLVQC